MSMLRQMGVFTYVNSCRCSMHAKFGVCKLILHFCTCSAQCLEEMIAAKNQQLSSLLRLRDFLPSHDCYREMLRSFWKVSDIYSLYM